MALPAQHGVRGEDFQVAGAHGAILLLPLLDNAGHRGDKAVPRAQTQGIAWLSSRIIKDFRPDEGNGAFIVRQRTAQQEAKLRRRVRVQLFQA